MDRLAVVAPDDAWAVGYSANYPQYPITEHWDGASWSIVPAPTGEGPTTLYDVSAAASDDVWAVGVGGDGALFMHWNGSAWSIIEAPGIPRETELHGVVAISDSDVWAVGNTTTGFDNLAVHWNGTSWRVVPSPPVPGATSGFLGAGASSSNDVWAVGGYNAGNSGGAVIEHWDGRTWSLLDIPNPGSWSPLEEVDARTGSDAWAVGSTDNAPLAMHWDGSSWTVSSTPNPGIGFSILTGVAALSVHDVWAVGSYYPAVNADPLLLHWDGTTWAFASSAPTRSFDVLRDVEASSAGQLLAAGWGPTVQENFQRLCPVAVRDTGFGPRSSAVRQGDTAAWVVPASDPGVHTVSDASGMELFGSGLLGPGDSFTTVFIAAGSYPIEDEETAATSRVDVPAVARPARGDLQTTFTVQWSSGPAPEGFVFDVQILRPGDPAFGDWLVGMTEPGTLFTPDGGVGTYAFRARLRSAVNGAASGYSHPAKVTVS